MLGDDDGEEGFLEGVGLTLKGAEGVVADVGVLRGEGDEAAFGQADGELVVIGAVD